ncbi:HD domain-containing protein [Enterocloster citroniae]
MKKQYNVDKMYTYLRGFLVGAQLNQSIKALSFAREKHKDQKRKDGIPYIVHPLQMACYAVALGIRDDDIIAGALLHDVCEDCGVPVSFLPVNDNVKQIVKYMTITPLPGEEKADTKRRYFRNMLECKGSVIVKGLDRYHNMSTMAGVLSPEAIRKNIIENEELLLPMMKEAKEKYPELSDIMFILRTNISDISYALRDKYFDEESAETDEKNKSDAE